MSSINKQIEKIEDLISSFEYDNAIKTLERNIKKYPNETSFLDLYGDLNIQIGDIDKAREMLLKSIEMAPTSGASKYMNLGQITGGAEAMKCYQRGIEILNEEKNQLMLNNGDENVIKNYNNNIISALCSIAELYMTDECEEENAEEECEKVLMEAVKIDDKNYEVLQLVGSFKISQNKKDEAINYLMQSRENWNLNDDGPPPEVKINFVKLLLELEQFEVSSQIIEELIEENDSDSELWYLYAFSLSTIDPQEARIALDKCGEILTSCGIDSPNVVEQVEELNEKINNLLQNLPQEDEQNIDMENEVEMDSGEEMEV